MDMSENTFGVSSSPLCVGNWLQQHNVFPVLDCEVQLVVWVKVAVQGLGDDFRLCLLRQWVHVLVFSALLGSTMDTRSCLSLRSLGDFTQFLREGLFRRGTQLGLTVETCYASIYGEFGCG